MKPIISIIGATGKMGSLFSKALKEKGYEVLIAGRNTEIKPIEAAKKGDIVIVSVPIRETEKVIRDISPHVRKDSILSDFTSIKTLPCKIMKENSNSEIIGGHPVFGPSVELKGQTFVLCPIKAKESSIKHYTEILESLGLNVIQMTPKEHDRYMAIIQCMNQFDNLAFANALKNINFDLSKRELFSPNFSLKINILKRMLEQEASLYSDIETLNPYAKEFANEYSKALTEIKRCIDKKDEKELERIIITLQKYFIKTDITDIEEKIITEKLDIAPEKISDEKHKIALLGPEYSYCHILGEKAFPKSKFVLCGSIEEIFKLVAEGKVPFGLSPIENMLGGSVREAIFSLKKYHVKINKLFNLPIHHCLASQSQNFKKIVSHQQALAQCSLFLNEYKEKKYEIMEAPSTSKAMDLASKNGDYAAIGSLIAAKHYNLNILKKDIEDNSNNITSFIMISKEENKKQLKGKVRTSILIVPDKDKPGLLYEILSAFKKSNINLTKIESIPTGNKIGEYIFYIEFDGDLNEENIKQTTDILKSLHNFYSLGSYLIEDIQA